jgi:hypothetical protein
MVELVEVAGCIGLKPSLGRTGRIALWQSSSAARPRVESCTSAALCTSVAAAAAAPDRICTLSVVSWRVVVAVFDSKDADEDDDDDEDKDEDEDGDKEEDEDNDGGEEGVKRDELEARLDAVDKRVIGAAGSTDKSMVGVRVVDLEDDNDGDDGTDDEEVNGDEESIEKDGSVARLDAVKRAVGLAKVAEQPVVGVVVVDKGEEDGDDDDGDDDDDDDDDDDEAADNGEPMARLAVEAEAELAEAVMGSCAKGVTGGISRTQPKEQSEAAFVLEVHEQTYTCPSDG